MFRLILVPLDGSPLSEQALTPALALARRQQAAVRLVRVYVPIAGAYGQRGVPFDPSLDDTLKENAAAWLNQLVERTAAPGVHLDAQLLEGPVAESIEQYAASSGADLLVMTTHARGPFARFWLGSVADRLVRLSTIPILFIPPADTAQSPPHAPDSPVRHVLIPLDGSELAEQVLESALELGETIPRPAAGDTTRYTLLRVIPTLLPITTLAATASLGGVPESVYQALRDEHHQHEIDAMAYLERLADTLLPRGHNIQVRLTAGDYPADAILEEAAAHGVDLIALTTRGQGGLKRLLLGSVADKVLRGTSVPVLIHPPAERAASTRTP